MSHQSANIYITRPDCEEIEVEVFGTIFGDEVQDVRTGRVLRDCIHNDSETVIAYTKGQVLDLTGDEITQAEHAIWEVQEAQWEGEREALHLERYYFER